MRSSKIKGMWPHMSHINSRLVLAQSSRNLSQKKMTDEYGQLDSAGQSFHVPNFCLESGLVLANATVSSSHYSYMHHLTHDENL
jgi:hypothetical protein